jgi:glyoxylate utilization-related uncharacterized protein
MKISREKLISVVGILTSLSGEKTTAKGAYAILKNKKLIEAEIKNVEETQKALKYPDLTEFHSKRIELCNEFADKDEEGKPKLEEERGASLFVFSPENRVKFNEKLIVLMEEHKDVLDEHRTVDLDFTTFLKEEVEVSVHEIKLNDLPNGISAAQIELLGDIVVE